jgi:starch synthase
VSFLKGGIVYSDAINTVSPTYAREIQMPELGFGMDGVLRGRTRDLFGVLNGIDVDAWDPEKDPLIAARYGAETLDRKLTNKRALKQRVGLGGPHEVPLASIVSRLTHQKGIDIIIEALPELAKIPIQVAIVGAGDKDLVEKLRARAEAIPRDARAFHRLRRAGRAPRRSRRRHVPHAVALRAVRDEPDVLATLWHAADRERHGRARRHDPRRAFGRSVAATGYLLDKLTPAGLVAAVERAVAAYRDPAHWRRIQKNGMAKNFGWGAAAHAYSVIYGRIRSTS